MYYIAQTRKSFDEAVSDLESAVKNNGFGVLYIHDLAKTLRDKGKEFTDECKIFEVCNPGYAANVLEIDIRLNMALPCRISVYTKSGNTFIGLIEPEKMLSMLSDNEKLKNIAGEVQKATIKMVDEAK